MRIAICTSFVLCATFLCAFTVNATRVRRKDVQKRFVLMLSEQASEQQVRQSVTALVFKDKPARCIVLRSHRTMRMLTVHCGAVESEKMALLMNALLKEIPGVERSTPDAILASAPSESRGQDSGEALGPQTSMFAPASRMQLIQSDGTTAPYNWGLDRIDEDLSPLDNMPVDFSCYPSQGAQVKVFVIDTGCDVNHGEFTEADISTLAAPGSDFASGDDDHGHGTHIAGVVIGKNVGIARKASVTCIKAFDKNGNGAATDTISAVEYVIEEKEKDPSVPFIVNLSYSALTGFSSTALDDIVYASSAHGIVFVVSAGNAAVNACLFSPSKAEQALTVTASTQQDTLEFDSNIGPCVEFIAPGHEIVSAGIDSRNDYEALNGTSMATPHVAGLAALVLAENPSLQQEPRTVRDKLYEIMVTTRSASVADFIMPLMETGCEELVASMEAESSEEPMEAESSEEPMEAESSEEPMVSESPDVFEIENEDYPQLTQMPMYSPIVTTAPNV